MAWLSVLGIPAAVYVVSITALMFDVNKSPQNPLLLLGVGLLTSAIYTFHRTSIEPVEQMQRRHLLSLRHKKKLLLISCGLLILATVLLAIKQPLQVLLVFTSVAGVLIYGRELVTKPLRNYLYVKPLAVGTAISVLAWALDDFSTEIVILLSFIFICSADALVCDLADCEYDTATGCKTLATKYGRRVTWSIAATIYVVAAVGFQSIIGLLFVLLFPLPLVVTNSVRTTVDVRPLLVLLLAWSI